MSDKKSIVEVLEELRQERSERGLERPCCGGNIDRLVRGFRERQARRRGKKRERIRT